MIFDQFWYTQETANTVAKEVIEACPDGQVACVSCPTLYREFKRSFPDYKCTLLEYDKRFEVLEDFVLYDYKHPLELPDNLKGAFDAVVADPPYLVQLSIQQYLCLVRALKY